MARKTRKTAGGKKGAAAGRVGGRVRMRKMANRDDKAPIDQLRTRKRQDLLRLAVIEHHRKWVSFDGVECGRIALNGGNLNSQILKRIAREYSLRYAFPKGDEAKTRAAETINQATLGWPSNELVDRAKYCINLATDLKNDGLTHGVQLSAVSKLLWFLRPDGWTLFDTHAANSLGISSSGNTAAERGREFYLALAQRKFERDAARIQKTLNEREVSYLFAGRVIDKFLMLVGLKMADPEAALLARIRGDCEAYSHGVLPDMCPVVIEVSKDIAEAFGETLLRPQRRNDNG